MSIELTSHEAALLRQHLSALLWNVRTNTRLHNKVRMSMCILDRAERRARRPRRKRSCDLLKNPEVINTIFNKDNLCNEEEV